MSERWLDQMARQVAARETTRRGLARIGAGGALAGLALDGEEAAAACKPPKKQCDKGKQCCTGTCKKGKCGRCADGAVFLPFSEPLCWLTWGSEGSGDGQFIFPFEVAVGAAGQVYVADTENHRIQGFDATGGFVRTWGSLGSGDGQFNSPSGVAVDAGGRVYVADLSNSRIVRTQPL